MVAVVPTEDQEQIALAQYLDARKLAWCHVPNGGSRNVIEATKLKRMGTRRGIPDVLIFDPCLWCESHYVGIAIELKRVKGGRVTPEQDAWHHALEERGWLVRVCKGAGEAIDFIQQCVIL